MLKITSNLQYITALLKKNTTILQKFCATLQKISASLHQITATLMIIAASLHQIAATLMIIAATLPPLLLNAICYFPKTEQLLSGSTLVGIRCSCKNFPCRFCRNSHLVLKSWRPTFFFAYRKINISGKEKKFVNRIFGKMKAKPGSFVYRFSKEELQWLEKNKI